MPDKFTLEQIREFWTQQAREHGQEPTASWSDRMLIELEIRTISERLRDGDRVGAFDGLIPDPDRAIGAFGQAFAQHLVGIDAA